MAGAKTPLDMYLERTPRSRALWERAQAALPGGNSRSTIFFPPYPPYVVEGKGCRITDLDGNERIDFLGNYTSLILGHAHPAVVAALRDQAGRGTAFASPTELEVRLAELITGRMPSVERIRFTNSGTEATMFALRAARAYTGREKVAKFEGGYHGTHDHALISVHPPVDGAGPREAPRALPDTAGIPGRIVETVIPLPWNDADAVERIVAAHAKDLAAVIAEPILGAGGIVPPREGFLRRLREVTARHDVLLILDEVIGFRLSYHGAQGYYGLAADLTTFGKIIGGGLPVGAFGGRADIMEQFDPRRAGRLDHGGTFNANPMTMAAGVATLEALTPEVFARLEAMGKDLRERLSASLARRGAPSPPEAGQKADWVPAQVSQVASLFNVHFTAEPVVDYRSAQAVDPDLRHRVYLALLNRGIFLAPRMMGALSVPMGEAEIAAFADALDGALSDAL